MARLKQIKIGVDPLTEAKLTVRAEQAGCNVSEYVRDLILKDVSRSGSTDFLLPQLVELGLVTGILVRAQLGHVIGEDEARTLEARARERATEQLEALLAESGAERA
jgi:hypothetical protein